MLLSRNLMSISNFSIDMYVPAIETIKISAMKRILLIMMLGAIIFLGFSPVVSAEKKALKQVDGSDEPACDEDEKQDSPARKRSHFKGHWGGFEIGLNNYFTDNYDFTIPTEIKYMSLHSGKSRNFNLNFGQLSIGLARHLGFVTGLGIGWNNYMFAGDNNIIKNADGDIVELERENYYPDQTLKKSKFSTFYLKLPVLFEVQIPTDHQRLNLSAGPIGALKLGSYSVMLFENDDKIKSDDDFNLNLFRYGVTARIGYENFNIYGTYYFTPLFKTNMGPGGVDLYPFEIGIAFTIDN